jgi:hypothetical protein
VDLTISRPVKIFALVAVIAAVGGASMLMLKPKPTPAPVVVSNAPAASSAKTATTPAASTPAASAPAAKAHAKATPSKAKPKTAAAPAGPATGYVASTAAVPKSAVKVAANGLPSSIDDLFKKHAIVVVSVFDPESSTDAISYAEAKAGAADAGVGFVGVSLLDSPLAAALTTALPGGGLLPAPGVLIYRRPGTLVQRLDGFTDRDVVAQAAAASVTAPPITGAGGGS